MSVLFNWISKFENLVVYWYSFDLTIYKDTLSKSGICQLSKRWITIAQIHLVISLIPPGFSSPFGLLYHLTNFITLIGYNIHANS